MRPAAARKSSVRGARDAVVAFGVEHDQVGSVKIGQLDGLFGPLGFDRRRAAPLEERAQHFARLGRSIDDQNARQRVHASDLREEWRRRR